MICTIHNVKGVDNNYVESFDQEKDTFNMSDFREGVLNIIPPIKRDYTKLYSSFHDIKSSFSGTFISINDLFVFNQRDSGTCWAQATALYLSVYLKYVYKIDNGDHDVLYVNPSWIFSVFRKYKNNNLQCLHDGQSPYSVLQMFVDHKNDNYGIYNGILYEEKPYIFDNGTCEALINSDIDKNPFSKLDDGLKKYKVEKVYSLSQNNFNENLKKELHIKGAVIAVIDYYHSLWLYKKGEIYQPKDGEPQKGKHLIVIIGYHDPQQNNTGYWICQNSWGKKWGNDGKFYLSMQHADKISFSENCIGCDIGKYPIICNSDNDCHKGYICQKNNCLYKPKHKCCWDRLIQSCNVDSDCDGGGEGCIVSGENTEKYGKIICNTCEDQLLQYNETTQVCEGLKSIQTCSLCKTLQILLRKYIHNNNDISIIIGKLTSGELNLLCPLLCFQGVQGQGNTNLPYNECVSKCKDGSSLITNLLYKWITNLIDNSHFCNNFC